MSFKIQIIGNAVEISDTVSGEVLISQPAKDSWFEEESLDKDLVVLYGTTSTNADNIKKYKRNDKSFKGFPIAECVDVEDVAFTVSTFRTFCYVSLGKSSASESEAASFEALATLFETEKNEDGDIVDVKSIYDLKFPNPVVDSSNQIINQYYDVTNADNSSLIDIKYEGNWFVNLPSIDSVDDNFEVYIVHKQDQDLVGNITAYSGDLIDGNGNKKIYGQGFIDLKKIKVGVDVYQWFVFSRANYNTVEMQGKTRRLDFTNLATIQLQHDLGFIPITQVWIEDGEGGFVEVNVDIDHDWQTMNSLEISFGTPQTGKIIY